jgi:hypothetical protein
MSISPKKEQKTERDIAELFLRLNTWYKGLFDKENPGLIISDNNRKKNNYFNTFKLPQRI